MVDMIPVSKNELEALRETCSVRKRNPFGLTIEEYESNPYIVKGTYDDLFKLLERRTDYPLKILVCLEE